MRVLAIGGTGFLGRYLIPDLAGRGAAVAVLSRGLTGNELPPGVERITGDRKRLVDSASAVRSFAPDVVVDCVLSSGTQARALMDVCRGVARRVVALSSMDVYRAVGVTHQLEPGPLEPLPLHEGSALRTRLQTYPPEQVRLLQRVFGWLDDEYDKIPVEQAVLGDPELPGTVLRLPMIYGPGDPLHRLFALLKRMDDRRPVILLQESFASWRGTRGYVENVASAVALAATSEGATGRVYNVGEREYHSELEWATRVAAVAGWKGEFRLVPGEQLPPYLRVPGNTDQHWLVDSSRIRDELGYVEPVPADVGLRRTIEWERAHPPAQVDPQQFDYETEDAYASGGAD